MLVVDFAVLRSVESKKAAPKLTESKSNALKSPAANDDVAQNPAQRDFCGESSEGDFCGGFGGGGLGKGNERGKSDGGDVFGKNGGGDFCGGESSFFSECGSFDDSSKIAPKPRPRVLFLPKMPPRALKAHLRFAKISVLPSFLYETFGLTVAESILGGALPIVSDIGALGETRETFGALGFSPSDKNSLKNAIEGALLGYENALASALASRESLLKNNARYLCALKSAYED